MAKTPKPKFMMIGKGKYVHTFYTKAYDLKHSQCTQARKAIVAGKIDYKHKGISPEAALALDGCEACATRTVAEAQIDPKTKREAAKDRRDEVLARARGDKPKKSKGKQAVSSKSETGDKPKPKKQSMTKSGPRSTASRADGDPTQIKAKMLADFGAEHGWKTSIGEDKETGHTVVTATRGEEVITAWYIDGKYDINRHAETRVGEWTGKLRGAHACRRQMAGEGRDRVHPEPGKGRTGPRKKVEADEVPEDESPEDAAKRVPFNIDDPDIEIIDAIKGKTIRWRNGVSNSIEEGWLPSQPTKTTKKGKEGRALISITAHPKTGKRMVSFLSVAAVNEHGEVYGPERVVYLDKIVRVVN